MRVKCTDSTSCRKRVTRDGFSDIDVVSDANILAVSRCFSPIYGDFSLRLVAYAVLTTCLLPIQNLMSYSVYPFS